MASKCIGEETPDALQQRQREGEGDEDGQKGDRRLMVVRTLGQPKSEGRGGDRRRPRGKRLDDFAVASRRRDGRGRIAHASRSAARLRCGSLPAGRDEWIAWFMTPSAKVASMRAAPCLPCKSDRGRGRRSPTRRTRRADRNRPASRSPAKGRRDRGPDIRRCRRAAVAHPALLDLAPPERTKEPDQPGSSAQAGCSGMKSSTITHAASSEYSFTIEGITRDRLKVCMADR